MMNHSIITLLGLELVVLAIGFTLTWIVISWRQRLQRDRSLAEMIDLLEQNSAERNLHYRQWLVGHQLLDEAEAEKVAREWMGVEKHFWQAFLAWHLQPDQNTLADFPHHLQRLLNSRLDILGKALGPTDILEELPPEQTSAVTETEEYEPTLPSPEDLSLDEGEEAEQEIPSQEGFQEKEMPSDESQDEENILQEGEEPSDDRQTTDEAAGDRGKEETVGSEAGEEGEIVVYSDRNPTATSQTGNDPTPPSVELDPESGDGSETEEPASDEQATS